MSSRVEQSFLGRVEAFIRDQHLLQRGAKYIVALSGGADSVALLCTLRRLGVDAEAATCNFHLRGEESQRDEMFCVSLCKSMGVALHRAHFDTHTYAQTHKMSIEMAARELRYAYFERLRCDIGADAICVAHHRDDSVETVLLNLVRGTGLRGLRGILPRNGHILRPLLCVGRKDIEEFLLAIGQDYVTDSTNLVPDVKRNKMRLEVLPLLESISPSARQSIFETSLNAAEAYKVYAEAMQASCEASCHDGVIDIEALKRQASPESTLFHLLQPCGFTPAVIRDIYNNVDAQSGRMWSSDTHEALIDRGRIVVEKKHGDADKTLLVSETGNYVYAEDMKFTFELLPCDATFKIDRSRHCACLDAAKVAFPLTIRHTQKADRFVPFGMTRSKLVSDYMTDTKHSLFEKRAQLVVADATGAIVWLVGKRTDNRFRVGSATASVLKIVLHA